MALFCGVYGWMAWYAAAVEHDRAAFIWVTAFAVLALGSSLSGYRVWRAQKRRDAAAELARHAKEQHRHPPQRPRGKHHH